MICFPAVLKLPQSLFGLTLLTVCRDVAHYYASVYRDFLNFLVHREIDVVPIGRGEYKSLRRYVNTAFVM